MNRILPLFFLALGAFLPGIAQIREPRFNQVTGSNGISLGKINAVVQDKLGFLWLSDQTNRCLVRYDGSFMKRYPYTGGKPNTLGGHYPECLAVDRDSTLWIGFYGQGLDHFDPIRGTFRHYSHSDTDPATLSDNTVSAVLVDQAGNVWVGTNSGLNLLDRATGEFMHFRHNPADSSSLSHDVIRAIYEDRSGVLWVGTGMAFVPDPRGGLNRFDRESGTFKRYQHDPTNANSLIDNRVRSIFEDSYGNFWVGTSGDGLHRLDRTSGRVDRLTYDPTNPTKLSRPPLLGTYDHITFITEDIDRKLWIGTLGNGIVRYDSLSRILQHFGKNPDPSEPYRDNTSWLGYPTPDGHLWLSTQNSNFFRIDLTTYSFPYIELSPSTGSTLAVMQDIQIQSYFEESPSVDWLGSSAGLIRLDRLRGARQIFRHDPKDPNTLSNNSVWAIHRDREGIFWFGTSDGLNRYDPISQRFQVFRNIPNDPTSLPSSAVIAIYEGKDGTLWLGSESGGITSLGPERGAFRRRIDWSVTAWNIIETGQNHLWFSSDQGLGRINLETQEVTGHLFGAFIQALHEDQDHVLWVGTNTGLFRHDRSKDDFIPVAMPAGVNSIVTDDKGNLWMTSTTLGLVRLDPTNGQYVTFGTESDIIPEGMTGSELYKLSNGHLVLRPGLIGGLQEFDPSKLTPRPGSSILYLTSFAVFNASGESAENSHGALLLRTKAINLAHQENAFTVRFTEIDFRNKMDARILYKLEGFDNDWRGSFPEEAISYFGVPPGAYTFRIKASNAGSGLWSEEALVITIAPPWWTTWWAYTLYGIGFAGSVFAVDRVQRRRIVARQRELSRERELEQAREIEKAYNELKSTQAQLIQSEKMASLGELTAGIAHEIQNPLNFVNNFSEVNKELVSEMNEALTKGDYTTAMEIARNISENQEKITHHGKRADGIVKGMLMHSRSSSGKKEPTDINALTDEYLRLAYHGLRAKDKSFNATFRVERDETLGPVNVVPQEIGRAILNLITNAFHAVAERSASSGGDYTPMVTVSTHRLPGKFQVRVKDNGNGIPANVRGKIFQPFFTTKPAGKGTGLGLSITYDIVKAQGGEITVQTKEGEGTEFCITLPD